MTSLGGLLLVSMGAWGAAPPRAPEFHEVVIVGGGLAGLSAAHVLRDRDVLLLEKEPRAGGKARPQAWGALRYTMAATYLSEPYGDIRRLFDDLGLESAPIPHPQDSLWSSGRVIADFLDSGIGRLPHPAAEIEGLRRMAGDMKRLADGPLVAMPPVPGRGRMTPRMRALDRATFSDFLGKTYGGAAAVYGDLFCRGLFGAGAGDVSALQGVNALGAQYGPTAAFEGGLGAVAEALEKELGRRLRTNAMVVRVEQDASGVSVTYRDPQGAKTVRARAAVLAVDAPTLLKIAPGLSEPRARDLRSVRYSAYALVVLALREPLPLSTMSLWSLGTSFTDLSSPGAPAKASHASGEPAQLVLAAAPFGAGKQGALDGAGDAEIVDRITKDASAIFPRLPRLLLGARVIRWRHAMPVVEPGYLTRLRPRLASPEGRLYFAGQETEMPYSEGAIVSGYRAAAEVRARLSGIPTGRR